MGRNTRVHEKPQGFLSKARVCKYCRYFMGRDSEQPCSGRRCRDARSLAYRLEGAALKAGRAKMKPRDAPRYFARVNAQTGTANGSCPEKANKAQKRFKRKEPNI